MTKKQEISRRYDASAEIYDNRYTSIQSKKYSEIISRIDIGDAVTLIDVGCGTGSFFALFKNNPEISGPRLIVGVDISYEMIKIAHKKFPEFNFIVADSDRLPFLDGIFDVLVSVTHLQNLPEPTTSAKEMVRVTTKQAQILISILRKSWSLDQLRQLMTKVGLRILDDWTAEVEDIGIHCSK